VHASCEDKGDDIKDSLYEELGGVIDQFTKYDMKILLGDFNVKVGRENTSNQQSDTTVYMKLVMTMESE
jgi:hypothetical protein